MIRYLAAFWNSDDMNASAAAARFAARVSADSRSWRTVLQKPGLVVWDASSFVERPDQPDNDVAGVVIGRVFTRSGARLRSRLERSSIDVMLADRGSEFTARYWGNYVAFAYRIENGEALVLRDPSGAIPCFCIVHDGVVVIFSDIGDVFNKTSARFSINDTYIAASLRIPKLQKTVTGLREVSEVLPGEAISLLPTGLGKKSFTWDPMSFVGREISDLDEAATKIEVEVTSVLSCLASEFDRVVMNIGGLDSSILWSLLSEQRGDKAIGMTLFTRSKAGDERHYTRLLAEFTGKMIAEIPLEPDLISFDAICNPRPAVSPLGFVDIVDLSADLQGWDEIANAPAYFYGVGGDNIFLQAAGSTPLLDSVARRGIFIESLAVLSNTARYSRRSVVSLAREAFWERMRPEPTSSYLSHVFLAQIERRGISAEVLAQPMPSDLLHPLLQPREGMLKGKYTQILSSCFAPSEYYDPYWPKQKERLHVFLSQPLVETCLAIPSWLLTYGGIDRGLARYTFRRRLPEPILRRLSKGTPEQVYARFVDKNKLPIQSFLMDGELVRRGIFDRAGLETMFVDERVSAAVYSQPIVQFLGLEAWARGWAR